MDSQSINFAMEYVTCYGMNLSLEHRLCIQASLNALKKSNQYMKVQLLGRIIGSESDYYIACGIGQDYIQDRTFYYSTDSGVVWMLLPPPTDLIKDLGLQSRGSFTGNPNADCETEMAQNDNDEIEDGEDWTTIKEEERLSSVIAAIQNDISIVPRGALVTSPEGLIQENYQFKGLRTAEATQLHSYYHVRNPQLPWDKNIVSRSDYNIVLDFLDSISHDYPMGCWSIKLNELETTVTLRSLLWPGLISYHVLETKQFGWFYGGNGRKNWDLPFMIRPPPKINRASLKDDEIGEDYEESGSEEELQINSTEPAVETAAFRANNEL